MKFKWPALQPQTPKDSQGWLHDLTAVSLDSVITVIKAEKAGPLTVIELGSWLGKSTRFIRDRLPSKSVIHCVDTWEGSVEHKDGRFPDAAAKLDILFDTFIANNWQYREQLNPVKATSVDGLRMLYEAGVKPDLIYVDASHEYEDVVADLEHCRAYFPDAIIVGDDYNLFDVSAAVEFVMQCQPDNWKYSVNTRSYIIW